MLFWLATVAWADEPRPTTTRPELMTAAPLHMGGGVLFEIGPGIRLGLSLGVLPRPYVKTINGFIGALEPTYDANDAALVENSLQRSLTMRAYGGWRPWEHLGLYSHLGVTYVGLGGGATAADLVSALLNVEATGDDGRLNELVFNGQANLFLFDTEVGWDQPLWRGLTLRFGLGWSFTVGSRTTLEADRQVDNVFAQAVIDELEVGGAEYLDALFGAYAHPPTATLALGWKFP